MLQIIIWWCCSCVVLFRKGKKLIYWLRFMALCIKSTFLTILTKQRIHGIQTEIPSRPLNIPRLVNLKHMRLLKNEKENDLGVLFRKQQIRKLKVTVEKPRHPTSHCTNTIFSPIIPQRLDFPSLYFRYLGSYFFIV